MVERLCAAVERLTAGRAARSYGPQCIMVDTVARHLGISEEQAQFLQGKLEKAPATIDQEILDKFERDGADPALLTMLRGALGTREEMEIRWHRV